MVRQAVEDEDWDEESDGGTDELDAFDENDLPTIDCPYCGWLIPEDTPRCPYCEHFISEEDAPPARKPWWIIAGVVVCLYIVYRWIKG